MALVALVRCGEPSPGTGTGTGAGGAGATSGDAAGGSAGAVGAGGGQGGSGSLIDAAAPHDGGGGSVAEAGSLATAIQMVLSEDGGWCWFESPRAILRGDQLIVGSVASGWKDPARKGDIELIVYDFRTQQLNTFELHNQLELDDHDSPALLVRSDKKLLAMFAKHNVENHFYYRVSES